MLIPLVEFSKNFMFLMDLEIGVEIPDKKFNSNVLHDVNGNENTSS